MTNKRLLLGLVLLITTAGCMGLAGGDAPVDQTPDSSELVMHFDMDGLQDDPETNRLSEITSEQEESTTEADIDEVESELQDELDIDPDSISTVLLFVEDIESSEQSGEQNFGIITHGSFEAETVVDAIQQQEDDLTETEYNGHTLYTTEDASLRGGTSAVGVLGDGQVIVGDQQSVESAIDTAEGDTDALSGELRSEYDRTTDEGLVGVAIEFPEETVPEQGGAAGVDPSVFESVNIMSAEYYTSDGAIGTNVRLLTESSSDAEDITSVIDGALVTFGNTGIPEIDAEIDNLETQQDGSTVTASYEGDLDDIEALLQSF